MPGTKEGQGGEWLWGRPCTSVPASHGTGRGRAFLACVSSLGGCRVPCSGSKILCAVVPASWLRPGPLSGPCSLHCPPCKASSPLPGPLQDSPPLWASATWKNLSWVLFLSETGVSLRWGCVCPWLTLRAQSIYCPPRSHQGAAVVPPVQPVLTLSWPQEFSQAARACRGPSACQGDPVPA